MLFVFLQRLKAKQFFGGGTQEEHRHSGETGSLADVAPISGKSGANIAALLAGQAPSVVVPMPLVGQVDAGAIGAPLEVAEQPVTEVILLPTSERTELPLVPAAPTVVGATPPVEALPMQAEVATTVTSQALSDAAAVVPEDATRSVPLAAQVTAPDVGQTEGDTAEGSPGVVAVVERTSGGLPLALTLGAATHLHGVSRCSSGWILKTQHRYSSRLMMLPRA